MPQTGRNLTVEFKAKVVLEVIRGRKSATEASVRA